MAWRNITPVCVCVTDTDIPCVCVVFVGVVICSLRRRGVFFSADVYNSVLPFVPVFIFYFMVYI